MIRITDQMRINWLHDRVSYLEHSDANGTPCVRVKKGCYWPQSMDQALNPCDTAIEDFADLSLIDHIDAQITLEGRT